MMSKKMRNVGSATIMVLLLLGVVGYHTKESKIKVEVPTTKEEQQEEQEEKDNQQEKSLMAELFHNPLEDKEETENKEDKVEDEKAEISKKLLFKENGNQTVIKEEQNTSLDINSLMDTKSNESKSQNVALSMKQSDIVELYMDESEEEEVIQEPFSDEEKVEEISPEPPENSIQKHIWGEWISKDDMYDERECLHCGTKQTASHVLITKETNVEANQDGTHMIKAIKMCSNCNNTFETEEKESCNYEISSYQRTGINDTHIEVKDCIVCKEHVEEEGTCVPIGELKLVKIYAQIYEYYDCELCGDMCKRQYHTNHQYGEWEHKSDAEHIRYCICIEAREVRPHDYNYDGNSTLTCEGCKDVKIVTAHNHGYGTYRNMGLMELIKSPAYGELVDTSQISNPNPNPNDYCSRYDFRCKACGVYYHVYFDHDFQNGFCTRKGYCGAIAQPTVVQEQTVLLQTKTEKVGNIISEDSQKEDDEGEDVQEENSEGEDSQEENSEGEDSQEENSEGEDSQEENSEGEDSQEENSEGEDVQEENSEGKEGKEENIKEDMFQSVKEYSNKKDTETD